MKTRQLACCALVARLCILPSLAYSDELRIQGFSSEAYESSMMLVERSSDAEEWMRKAKDARAFITARWEREAASLYRTLDQRGEAELILDAWLDDDLSRRFGAWLEDRFLGKEASDLRNIVGKSIDAAAEIGRAHV